MRPLLLLILGVTASGCGLNPSGAPDAPPVYAETVALVGVAPEKGDWPQWRGPDRSGVSSETGLLPAWPEKGLKLLWTYKNAGLGFSGPAIVGKTLYTLGSREDKIEILLVLDAVTGKELWSAPIGPVFAFDGNSWGDGPRSTPTIDGDTLFVLGGQGDLVCFNISGKKEVWRTNLLKDLEGTVMPRSDYNWGYSESPLVDGDMLIVTPGGPKGTLAALDKKTGKVQWRSGEQSNRAPYSSIIAADIHGVRQYVQTSYINDTKGGVISGYSAKDGKVLWTGTLFEKDSYAICPTPIVKGNLVYQTAGYGGGCHLFEIDKDMKAKDLYAKKAQKSVKNTHGGVILLGKHLFGHTERRTWFCQDFKTGKILWSDNTSLETDSGAITSAEGKLYLVTEEGVIALVDASPDEWKEISRFTLAERSKYPTSRTSSRSAKVWTHPVIAHGRLYLRDAELIFCYDLRGKD